MPKVLEGVVVSTKMVNTAVVLLTRKSPHPLYKKLIKKDRRIKVDTGGAKISAGDKIKIVEVRPISKTKHFRILEVIKK